MTEPAATPATVPCAWPVRYDPAAGAYLLCGRRAVARTVGILRDAEVYAGWTIEHAESFAQAHCQEHADLHRGVYSSYGQAFLTLPL